MLNFNPYFSKINNHKPIVFNLTLWVVAYVILLFSFTQSTPTKIDYIYTGSFLSTFVIPVIINMYVLIPKLLRQEKYILYVILFITNLALFTQLNIWFFSYFIDYVFTEYYFISYHSNTKLITIFSVFLVGTTLIKLSEDWFYFNRNENRDLKHRNQQIQTQLSSLRAQINPHFLFNSLNVIYALAVEKKDETKDAIVQLSDILRYIIYDSNTKKVRLKEEITLLENYIEFQEFRQHDSKNITFKKSIENENYTIYPMLLLPLVENSFKHGIKGDINNTFININMEQTTDAFLFYIENNYSKKSIGDNNEYSGLGLENIKQNLEIVYPKKHELKISKTEDKFMVTLKLNTNDN